MKKSLAILALLVTVCGNVQAGSVPGAYVAAMMAMNSPPASDEGTTNAPTKHDLADDIFIICVSLGLGIWIGLLLCDANHKNLILLALLVAGALATFTATAEAIDSEVDGTTMTIKFPGGGGGDTSPNFYTAPGDLMISTRAASPINDIEWGPCSVYEANPAKLEPGISTITHIVNGEYYATFPPVCIRQLGFGSEGLVQWRDPRKLK